MVNREKNTAPRAHEHPLEVLVVEDSESDAGLIIEGLQELRQPLNINYLGDGERAWRHFRASARRARPADLVFMDMHLPFREAWDLLKALRARPGWNSVPVVVFSSSENPADVRRCYELGASCVAAKPLDLDAFLDLVHAIARYYLQVLPAGQELKAGSRPRIPVPAGP